MLDFHEKRKLKALLYSKPALLVLLGIAVLLSFSVFERYQSEREMAEKRKDAEEELQALKGRAAALTHEVERLQSERGIEEELRDRFEIAKEGEEVFILVGNEREEGELGRAAPVAPAPSFVERLERFFWR